MEDAKRVGCLADTYLIADFEIWKGYIVAGQPCPKIPALAEDYLHHAIVRDDNRPVSERMGVDWHQFHHLESREKNRSSAG